jgi:small GTP-binding protein
MINDPAKHGRALTTGYTPLIAERPSLLTKYENLRRREYETLTKFVDSLGKVDGLPEAQLSQARDALFHADHPYLIVLTGPFNTGKSSMINALIGREVLAVSATPTTNKITILRHGAAEGQSAAGDTQTVFYPSPLLERVSLVDTPGLDSVFKGHDTITQNFLHRADLVLLVMLSTQAMTASNAAYLTALKDYGKRVIVVINQIDLVSEEDAQTIQNFVAEQARSSLGVAPTVWLVSAKWAMEAAQSTPRNDEQWRKSGFHQIEGYLNQNLTDSARVKQKLETPLQIARNVLVAANNNLRDQQDALAEYRRSSQNVRGQIDTAMAEQQHTAKEAADEVEKLFAESAKRGAQAINELFQLSRAFGLSASGFGEAVGFGRLFRRFGGQTPAQTAFATQKADEPLTQIPPIPERLAARLEGRDVKDADDLIHYAKGEISRLPGVLQTKVIGALNAPGGYDRAIMQKARIDLDKTLEKARQGEYLLIERAVRNTVTILGVYVFSAILLFCGVAVLINGQNNSGGAVLAVLMGFALAVGGMALIPLRGWLMKNAHARRVASIKDEYLETLNKAASDQMAYGRQLRGDAVAPFLRMVETQISQVDQVRAELENHSRSLSDFEAELGNLEKETKS